MTGGLRKYQTEVPQRLKEESNLQSSLQTKISILQERENFALKRCEKEAQKAKRNEELYRQVETENLQLEEKLEKLQASYFESKQNEIVLENTTKGKISKQESERLKYENEIFRKEVIECKAALHTYKNLYETSVFRIKSFTIQVERRRDETVQMRMCIRDLQINSADQQLIGKLYYILMLSRWQEAGANKKYEITLNDVKKLRSELYSIETQVIIRDFFFY